MKRFKIILCSLLLLPVLLLVGCGGAKSFSVITKTSNASLGSVSGGSTTPFTEGTDLKLIATPKNGVEFLCWIKDYQKITSTEATTSIKVSAKTAGNYTALFEESSHTSMVYAGLSEITYNAEDFSKIDYTVRYAPANNAESFTVLESGTMDGNSASAFTGSVFRMFENSNYVSYIFEVTIVVTNSAGSGAETITFKNNGSDMIIGNSHFTDGTATITKSNLTLKFSKINKEMIDELSKD